MNRKEISLVIAGEAGQGLATIGQAMAKALTRGGWRVVVTQSYHSRIRGGHNTMAIRASIEPLQAGAEGIDLLVALNQDGFSLHKEKLSSSGLAVGDASLDSLGLNSLTPRFSDLSAGRYHNTVALGIAARLMGLERSLMFETLSGYLGKLDAQGLEANRRAFDAGFDWAKARANGFAPLAPAEPAGRLMMNGNEALAMGALSAGLKFLSFYPMTPATSIALNVISRAGEMGVVVEQAEDEIAAVNMAIGAAFAGAPALVPTSGGGFALMTEGVSLAGMTETPLLIALAMRPGPATGLPTRTEQGDLDFALYGGHGEFARCVFAPGDIEECFHLARRALISAWRWQTPVIILTDQFLADSFRSVEPFEFETLEPVFPPKPSDDASYRRYELTGDGVSPLLLPGMGRALVRADSDEHTEDGHITEDLSVREAMADKRLAKLSGMKARALAPTYVGPDNPELLLTAWGSGKGAVLEARQLLEASGIKAAACHFSQVWPLEPEGFLPLLEAAKKVVMVEGNATGQFAGILIRETGFEVHQKILRYDGLPITPQFILRKLGA